MSSSSTPASGSAVQFQSNPYALAPNVVCANEAHDWYACLEPIALKRNWNPETGKRKNCAWPQDCADARAAFDRCVHFFRASIGDSEDEPVVRIRGAKPFEPPAQCFKMSSLSEKCMLSHHYDADACRAFVANYQHCNEKLYGRKWVTD